MRITHFSDIGLRVLIYLSQSGERRSLVTAAEIGSQFNIPLNHLVKVVGHLARAGWIHAARGRNGGLRLCVDAADLKIGIVLRELERDAELIDCEGLQCVLSQSCRLRKALSVGLAAFYEAMNAYSVLDISTGRTGEQVVRMHRVFLKTPHSAATS